ncbi:MAG: Asp23/Gls24 family envelope stress response protein [Clostridia bacterium]|nr:Asp23/Gls24 family envelope stress response protein [Clostridia bacterium]
MEEDKKEEIMENKEEIDTENSGVKISNDVVAVIAGVAVSEVQGVASMQAGFAGGISEVLSGKKNRSKGIKVEVEENTAKIDVNIIVEYGTRIPDVAFEIQNRVKKAVESMTGLEVEEVNVHVQGVNTKSLDNEDAVIEETKVEQQEQGQENQE